MLTPSLPLSSTGVRGDNCAVPPVGDVLLDPLQDSWLGIQIVHWEIKEALQEEAPSVLLHVASYSVCAS